MEVLDLNPRLKKILHDLRVKNIVNDNLFDTSQISYNVDDSIWSYICLLPIGLEMFEIISEKNLNNANKKAFLVYGNICTEIPLDLYAKEMERQEQYKKLKRNKRITEEVYEALTKISYNMNDEIHEYMFFLLSYNPNPSNDLFTYEYLKFCKAVSTMRESKLNTSYAIFKSIENDKKDKDIQYTL